MTPIVEEQQLNERFQMRAVWYYKLLTIIFWQVPERGIQLGHEPVFHQFFEPESSTYTYLLGDRNTGEAVLIDPVLETVERDLRLIQESGLKLKYILETHIHADHITGGGEIRARTGAKIGVSRHANVTCADIALHEGQKISFGEQSLTVLETPGHTDSCLSFLWNGKVFSGDALLIGGSGRTDFQQGSAERLYESVTQKLFTLPDETIVYPAHDYKGQMHSTIGKEKESNPRLGGGRTQAEFVEIMKELKLAQPKKINEAVPANMACGKMVERLAPFK